MRITPDACRCLTYYDRKKEMRKTELIKKISDVNDVYSFIVEVFLVLDSECITALEGEYATFCRDYFTLLHELRDITDILLLALEADFSAWQREWSKFVANNTEYDKILCYQTLKNIDELFPELTKPRVATLDDCGPLNNYSNQAAALYISPPDAFIGSKLINGHVRYGRQTIMYDVTGLNRHFKNYLVVKKACLNDYTLTVKRYNTKRFCQDEIKIGCTPFACKPWFEEQYNVNCTFDVVYNADEEQKHNEAIIALIEQFDSLKVDIVTFPELALSTLSLDFVKEFLKNKKLSFVKLICVGSCWNNRINESYILSREGTTLLTHRKKKAYERYSKEMDMYIAENIVPDKQITLLDVQGLGRISYNICRDYNDDGIVTLCTSVMKSSLVFVAAYSEDTCLMKTRARRDAELLAVTTVITNACAGARIGELGSYVVYPEVKDKHLIAKESICFQKNETGDICMNCTHVGIISKKDLKKQG